MRGIEEEARGQDQSPFRVFLNEQRRHLPGGLGVVNVKPDARMGGNADAFGVYARFSRRPVDPLLERRSDPFEVGDRVPLLEFPQRRERGHGPDRIVPVGAGNKHPGNRLHHLPPADHGSHGIAVRYRLREYGQVRHHARELLYPAQRDPETARHFVKNEHHAILRCQLAHPFQVSGRRQLRAHRLHYDAGHFVPVRLQQVLQHLQIAVFERDCRPFQHPRHPDRFDSRPEVTVEPFFAQIRRQVPVVPSVITAE